MAKTKEEATNYARVHIWINKQFGKAIVCEFDNCTSKPKRFEWALLKGKTYEKKRENFIMLCPSCHRKYDDTPERRMKLRMNHLGVKFGRAQLIKMAANLAKIRPTIPIVMLTLSGRYVRSFKTVQDGANYLMISRSTVNAVLLGTRPTGGGYKWVKKSEYKREKHTG